MSHHCYRSTVLTTITALLLGMTAGSSRSAVEILEFDRDSFPQLTVDLRVTDPLGNPLCALEAGDLSVNENGVPVLDLQVDPLSGGNCGRRVVLILSAGALMAGQLDGARQLALDLLDTLGPQDQASLVVYAGCAAVEVEMTSNMQAVRDALNQLIAQGGAAMADAVYLGLTTACAQGATSAVYIGNGIDLQSQDCALPLNGSYDGTLDDDREQILTAIGTCDTRFFAVSTWPLNETWLRNLSHELGGEHYRIADVTPVEQTAMLGGATADCCLHRATFASPLADTDGTSRELSICWQADCATLTYVAPCDPPFCPPDAPLEFSLPELDTMAGHEVDIDLRIAHGEHSYITSYMVRVVTSVPILEVLSAQHDAATMAGEAGWGAPVFYQPHPGEIRLSGAGVEPLPAAGTLVRLRARVFDDAPLECVDLSFEEVVFNEGHPAPVQVDGQLCVTKRCAPGRVSYWSDPSRGVPNVLISQQQARVLRAVSADDGSYEVCLTHGENVQLSFERPFDQTPTISALDAAYVLQCVVGAEDPSLADIAVGCGEDIIRPMDIAADVSGDGTISAYDASLLLQFAVGAIDAFPAGGWKFFCENVELSEGDTIPDVVGVLTGDCTGSWTPEPPDVAGAAPMKSQHNRQEGR